MKVIVAGSREFTDYKFFSEQMDELLPDKGNLTIVSGMARGPDSLAIVWAESHEVNIEKYPAQWNRYGRRAGFIRNAKMAEVADSLIAFYDGESRGTANMISTMEKMGKPVTIVEV